MGRGESSGKDLSPGRRAEPVLPIPVNPIIYAALRAIYAGGPKNSWTLDFHNRPHYHYQARDGRITIYYELPCPGYLPWKEPEKGMHAFSRHFLAPRWGFIYNGRLREAISELSVETADVFLILMSRIARLPDPRHGIARMRLEEIAGLRGVRLRHGSPRTLYQDFRREVLRLADLRLAMTWRDYKTGREMGFGRERADRLLDIIDLEYKSDGETLTGFGFRCGQALAQFLNPAGLRWIGYYSQALLRLSPYHEGFTKKLGTYWIMVGITAGRKGRYPQATPKSILDFCGEEANWRNPGQTVDAFISAHNRLQEIGVIDQAPVLEPANRRRGYFRRWLETPLSVALARSIWRVGASAGKNQKRPAGRFEKPNPELLSLPGAPPTPVELMDDPRLIRRFRGLYGIHQVELARALGVTRQTLSRYERGINPLPAAKADRVAGLWRGKRRST
ncbi:MAG: helix-turn-helix transcriptional regulator [Firmicutes bacterium]|nr:helix-turn-helix transcriptional regulator [Bacillota bacterium]